MTVRTIMVFLVMGMLNFSGVFFTDANTIPVAQARNTTIISDWARSIAGRHQPTEISGSDYTKPVTRPHVCDITLNMVLDMTGVRSHKYLPFPHTNWQNYSDVKVGISVAEHANMFQIMEGVGNNKFNPNGLVTREQMAVYLMNAIRSIETYMFPLNIPFEKADLSGYADYDQVSPWSEDSLASAVGMGVMSASADGRLNPQSNCTIEQALVICDKAWLKKEAVGAIPDGTYTFGHKNNFVGVNAQGKLELNSNAPAKFNVTFKEALPGNFTADLFYTIQTEDGKYLGVTGAVKDGSRLQKTDNPVMWKIQYAASNNVYMMYIKGHGGRRYVNASSHATKNGTPIILWTLPTMSGISNNAKFEFALQ